MISERERSMKCRACFLWNCWHAEGEYCTRQASDAAFGRCWCYTAEYVPPPRWLRIAAELMLPLALVYTVLFLWTYAASEVHGWLAMGLAAGMLVIYTGGYRIVEVADGRPHAD